MVGADLNDVADRLINRHVRAAWSSGLGRMV
jgi:hypothetical protein